MASAEELLMSALGSESEKLIINSDLRTITIPKTITNLGVESDEDVKRLYFQMPRHYGEFDLSEFAIRINYKNAKEEGDVYGVNDAVVTDDHITFSWLISRHVVAHQGDVEFSVCLRLIDAAGEILKEFNTTPASLPVLRGLETSEGVDKVMHDALATTALEAIERAQSTDLKGDPGYTPVKGTDYYTPDERESFAKDIIRDHNGVFANAIHGSAKGAVVRVDDISPIEHTVKAKVRGKNYFNVLKATTNNEIVNNGDGTLTVNTSLTSAGVPIYGVTLRYLAPNLEVGKVYTLSADSTGSHKRMYFSIPGENKPNTSVAFGGSFTVTEDLLRSQVFLYASGSSTTAVISNIQIEEGEVATGYEPYIDPTSVNATTCGKNLLPYPFHNTTTTIGGATYTDNGDGTISLSGTPTEYGSMTFYKGPPLVKFGKVVFSGIENVKNVLLTFDITKEDGEVVSNEITSYGVINMDEYPNATQWNIGIKRWSNDVALSGTVYPLLEVGDTPSEYEAYKPSVTYTPATDGSVDIASVSPTMTIVTDTPGAVIEAKYSRDINVVLSDIHAALERINGLLST